jgi:hypothetical protein
MRGFTEVLRRGKAKWGEKFDSSNLANNFVPYFESGQRIEVEFEGWGEEDKIQRGYVGVTTGWKPSFLLMRKSNSTGSDMLLKEKDKVLKTIPGKYRR